MWGPLWLLCSLALFGSSNQDVTSDASAFLQEFQAVGEKLYHQSALAQWEYNTNITNENAQKMVRTTFYTLLLWVNL